MSVTTMIGLRYYRARSTNGFISLVTMVSFIGLVLGVIALVVVVSVMNGFDRELKQRILGAVPHVTVSDVAIGELASRAGRFLRQGNYSVSGISAVNTHEMPGATWSPSTVSTRRQKKEASILGQSMVSGELKDLRGPDLELMLGQSIARRYGLGIGESISLVVPVISSSGGTVKPRLYRARLAGTLSHVGSELDHRSGCHALA